MMQQSKIVAKIRKLLALAQSSNEHEAAAAAARAAALMAAHQIAEATLSLEPNAESTAEAIGEQVLEASSRVASWRRMLIGGLTRAFACRGILRRDTGEAVIVVFGRPSDIDAVRYMWSYLTSEIDRLADENWRLAGESRQGNVHRRYNARSWKNSFRVSAAAVVANRLCQAREQALAEARGHTQASRALIKLDQHERALDARLDAMNLSPSSPVRIRVNGGETAGRRAGESINIGSNPGLGRPARQLHD